MQGMERIYESLLREYLEEFPCVAVIGPRQCGKTTLVHTLGNDWRYFDMERLADIAAIESDPGHFLRLYPKRVVLPALMGHPAAGSSWEGVVVEEWIRQLNALGASFDAYYYRTSGGAEVDLILEGFFGLIPIEIKRGQRVDARDLRSLKDFVDERNCPMGIVIQ